MVEYVLQCTKDKKISKGRSMRYFQSNHIICLTKDLISGGKIKRSLVNFVGLENTVTELATGCLRMVKGCYIPE